MVEILGKQIKTSLKEITLGEFAETVAILNDPTEHSKSAKYISLIELYGLSKEDVKYQLTRDHMITFNKALEESAKQDQDEINPFLLDVIEIGDRTYRAYTPINEGELQSDFTLLEYDIANIERAFRKDNSRYFLESIAILFKDEELSFREHYSPAHIKHKTKLFSEIPAIKLFTYITFIVNKIVNVAEEDFNKSKLDYIIENAEKLNKEQEEKSN